jgi:putative peptidoglycan lipid II flippase
VSSKKKRTLFNIAGIVFVATLISKLFGLFREQVIAAAFGVGVVVDAYSYAYIIPGFFLILLGGINGPFDSALVSVLSKRKKEEVAPLVETITTLVSGVLLIFSLIVILLAPIFIDLLAPGLEPTIRAIAIEELRIMSPLAFFAGLIGIGFGTLNASDQYWLPSISPLLSSVALIGGVGILALVLGGEIQNSEYMRLGGWVLAGGTLLGAIFQWLAQLIAQWRSGLGKLKLRFDWQIPGVKEVLKLMIPATLSSGMLHINVYTDMVFASYIENAASAMRYSNFIVLTPLGIISNTILVPFLPIFAKLTAPENWGELKIRIRQGLLLTALTMLPLSSIFISLSKPILRVIYQRGAFDSTATDFAAPVLMAYGVGMFFYLGRDVLVRVFYALDDAQTPFRISIGNIFLNAILDYFLVNNFQTPGLIYATIGVNVISMFLLLYVLNQRLNGLPLGEWAIALFGLIVASIISGFACWGTNYGLEILLPNPNLIIQIIQLGLGVIAGIITFGIIALQLKLPELDILMNRITSKLKRNK